MEFWIRNLVTQSFNNSGKESQLSRFRQVRIILKRLHLKVRKVLIRLEGIWSLSLEHNLCLTLNKWGRAILSDKVTLQAEIISIDKNALLFAVTTCSKNSV